MITPSLNSLGFPDWSFARLVNFAREHQVSYIELRGLENEMDLTVLPTFSSQEGLRRAQALLKENPPVHILSLNTGFRLLDLNADQFDHVRRYAELAVQMGAPYLRVFAGGANGSAADLSSLASGAEAMLKLLEPFPVQMLLETHDCLVRTADMLALNQAVGGRLNILWDVANQINFSGEDWRETWAQIAPLVRYLHMKDTRRLPDGSIQNVLLLEGDLPIRDVLAFLKQLPETVILSFEWEKRWDPSLEPGDIAASDYLKKLASI